MDYGHYVSNSRTEIHFNWPRELLHEDDDQFDSGPPPPYRSNPIVATRSNAIPSNPLIRIIIIIKWALLVRHN